MFYNKHFVFFTCISLYCSISVLYAGNPLLRPDSKDTCDGAEPKPCYIHSHADPYITCCRRDEFCDSKYERKCRSCFPEDVQNNAKTLKEWCKLNQGNLTKMKNDNCLGACLERFGLQYFSSCSADRPVSCHSQCCSKHEYCDTHTETCSPCVPPNVTTLDAKHKWCKPGGNWRGLVNTHVSCAYTCLHLGDLPKESTSSGHDVGHYFLIIFLVLFGIGVFALSAYVFLKRGKSKGKYKKMKTVMFIKEPVKLTQPLASVTVQNNKKLTLECTVSKPNKTATWYKNADEITPSERIKLHSEDCKFLLTVESAQHDDSAEYRVEIAGESSTVTSSCQVTVEEKLPNPNEPKTSGTPPTITPPTATGATTTLAETTLPTTTRATTTLAETTPPTTTLASSAASDPLAPTVSSHIDIEDTTTAVSLDLQLSTQDSKVEVPGADNIRNPSFETPKHLTNNPMNYEAKTNDQGE